MLTLFTFTFAKRQIQCNIAHQTQIYYNYDDVRFADKCIVNIHVYF